MGERLRRLVIEAFRGVPTRWELAWPRGESMVVWGPNGSGKSTIADALEWFYAGKIDFLAHEGRAGAIRNQAAPRTAICRVTVETTGSTGAIREAAAGTAASPWGDRTLPDSIVLRGRTLADFVEKPKADKFRTLAAILGLAEVDRLRMDLQTVRNQLEDARIERRDELRAASAALQPPGGALDAAGLLAMITASCAQAGISGPASLAEALDPAWLPARVDGALPAEAVAVAGLAADIEAAIATETAFTGAETWNAYLAATPAADPPRLRFVGSAETYLAVREDDGHCPLCGQLVEAGALAARIAALLDELQASASAQAEAVRALRRTATELRARADRLVVLRTRATELGAPVDTPPAVDIDVADAEADHRPVDLETIRAHHERTRAWLRDLAAAVAHLPAARPGALPLVELATQLESARRWQVASTAARSARTASAIADQLHAACQAAENARYGAILARISTRVAELYTLLHPDEGLAGVAIEPWTEKGVELVVEFHGERHRPPHGVLSESHLNSLAVALFLAMAELFNDHLDTIVLDDVVNSFDLEHRGRLAELLVTEFASRQLIVLTHDVAPSSGQNLRRAMGRRSYTTLLSECPAALTAM